MAKTMTETSGVSYGPRQWLQRGVTPEMVERCAVDIIAFVEHDVVEKLTADSGRSVQTQWWAESLEKDPAGHPYRLPWAPNQPIPDGTDMLIFRAVQT